VTGLVSSVGSRIDWPSFWSLFQTYATWNLEYYDGSGWVSVKNDLKILSSFPEANRCKFKLKFKASKQASYRLAFAVDRKLKGYIENLNRNQIEIMFDKTVLTFDWSDCANLGGLKFTHGLQMIAGEQYFWFMIATDTVSLGSLFEIDPSVVATSTDEYAVGFAFQGKTGYANGLIWSFYCDGSNIAYKTSSDNGATWTTGLSSPVAALPSGIGLDFAVYFEYRGGTYYLHYVRCLGSATSGVFYYRRGVLNSDGSITWSAVEQQATVSVRYWYYPTISVDDSGYPWIGLNEQYGGFWVVYVTTSSVNDGTWTARSGFPYALASATVNAAWGISIVPLTSGKMAAVWTLGAEALHVKSWNGSAWNTTVNTSSYCEGNKVFSAVGYGDTAHIAFLKSITSTSYILLHVIYTYSTNSLGTEATIASGLIATESAPALSVDPSTGNLRCFWLNNPTNLHVYYNKYESGSWASITDWYTESENIYDAWELSSYSQIGNNAYGLLYVTRLGPSSYNVKFAFLSAAAPPPAVSHMVGDGLTWIVC
jgi:hypothetical protein